ncbi:hypothetical protein ACP4OV_003416 [Aristida adscensionis]
MAHPPSPAAPATPLECDDLLAEILLRLPPHPASLARASLVCTRWRRLARDPAFLRRLRALHRAPPVLGFFHNSPCSPRFLSCAAPGGSRSPGRLARAAAALRRDADDGVWWLADCRRGRALLRARDWAELLVWDPVAAERREIPAPRRLRGGASCCNAAVLGPAAADDDCRSGAFRVVVVFTTQRRAFACVYSSAAGSWGEPVSAEMPSSTCELSEEPGALAGNALYWLLGDSSILEFHLGDQRLALVERPLEIFGIYKRNIRVVKSEGGGLGIAAADNFSLHLWAREIDHDGTAKWVLHKAIDLCALLALPSAQPRVGPIPVWISGLGEDGNVVFLRTMVGIFVVWLETMQFKNVTNSVLMKTVYPYASFYVPGEFDSGL